MIRNYRAPFTTPIRALRRAAWTCAMTGSTITWNDPMPAPSKFAGERVAHAMGGRPC